MRELDQKISRIKQLRVKPYSRLWQVILQLRVIVTVADPGGVPRGPWPPSPVQTSHKKDGRQRQTHRFHVSLPPPPGRWIRCCVNSSFVSGVFVLFNKNNVQRLGFRDCRVVCEMMVILIDQAKTNIEVQGFYIALTTVYQTKPR